MMLARNQCWSSWRELESGEAVALKVSHVEDVGAWVKMIREFLVEKKDPVLFGDLVRGLGMPVVAVWLGLLLGGFRVEQREGFYDQSIWVASNLG